MSLSLVFFHEIVLKALLQMKKSDSALSSRRKCTGLREQGAEFQAAPAAFVVFRSCLCRHLFS